MKKNTFLSIMLLFAVGCSGDDNVTKNLERIPVDVDKAERFADASFFIRTDSVEVISLETNPECLIGNATKVHLRGDKFVIYDELSKAVFIFNRDGTYHAKIHALGNGPGEYPPHVNDAVVMDSTVGMLVPVIGKIIEYDFNGNYVRDISLQGSWGDSFFTFGDDEYYLPNDWGSSDLGDYHFFALNTKENKAEVFLPFKPDKGVNRGWGLTNHYSVYDQRALVLVSTEDIIYEMSPTQPITPRYYVDIVKQKLPQELAEGDGREALMTAIKENYLTGVNKIMETSAYLILDISNDFQVIYDKAKKQVVASGEEFVIPEFGGYPVYLRIEHPCIENGILINALDPEIARHVHIDAYTEETIKNKDFAKKYLNAVTKAKDDDNPILIIYKTK